MSNIKFRKQNFSEAKDYKGVKANLYRNFKYHLPVLEKTLNFLLLPKYILTKMELTHFELFITEQLRTD